MTNEEAIKSIKSYVERHKTERSAILIKEALNMTLKALEKQIPKKVITETEDDREFIDYLCPSCRVTLQQKYKQSKISTIYKYKHCPDCGQALDWSVLNDPI